MYKSACSFLSTGLPKIFYLGLPSQGLGLDTKRSSRSETYRISLFLGHSAGRTNHMDTIEYATFRYNAVEVEKRLTSSSGYTVRCYNVVENRLIRPRHAANVILRLFHKRLFSQQASI